MTTIGNGFTSIEQVTGQYLNTDKQKSKTTVDPGGKNSFASILGDQVARAGNEGSSGTAELKFSKHASQRLKQRDIELSDEQSKRLQDGVEKAESKGIQNSLMLMDSYAFIVNVPSSTVVTAMDAQESKEKAFTNIDGAVIV